MKSKNKKTILLVEDEVILAMTEKINLEKYGYIVTTVQTGEEAIQIFKNNQSFDLILMDIDLGNGIDGTEAALLILRERIIPIIFLSSHTELEIVEKTEKITAYGYVVKNSGITILDASIKMAFKLFDANQIISESEIRYRAIVEGMPGIVYSFSNKKGGTYFSSNLKNFLGYTPDQLFAQPFLWHNSIHPNDIAKVEKAIQEAMLGKPFHIEYRIRDADGNWHHFEDRSLRYQIEGTDGTEVIIEGLALDITEQKRADSILQKSEEKFHLLFDTMSEGVALNEMIFNEEGEMVDYRILEVNKAFYTTADYSGKQVVNNVATNLYGMSKEMIQSFWNTHKVKNETTFAEMLSPLNNKYFYIATSPFKNNTFVTTFFDITILKQTEKRLKQSEINFKKAQQIAHVGSWSWNIETNKLEWSDEMYRIFGIQKETFSGILTDVIAQAIHPDDRGKVESSNLSVIEKSIPIPLEYRIIWSDKTIRTVWAEAGELALDDTGKPTLLTGIVQDITERKQMEESLLESEARFKSMFEMHHAIMLLVDPKTGFIIDANQSACNFYGYTKSKLCTMNMNEINELPHEKIALERENAIAQKRNFFVFPHKLASGEDRFVEVHSSPISYHEKLVLFSIIHDVTNRIEKEEEFERLSNERQTILDNIANGVFFLKKRKVITANKKGPEIYGYPMDEIIGEDTFKFYPSKEAYENFGKKAYPVLAKGKVFSSEEVQIKKNGEKFWCILTGQAINPNDLNEGSIWVLNDITETKIAADRIKSLLEEKEIILKEVHHRIKNNMSTINGLLTLQANMLSESSAIAALQDASRRVQSMMMLYDKLYRASDFQFIAVQNYLPYLVEEIIANFPNSKSVKIEKSIDDFTLDANRILPLGILINELLTNIMKYAFLGRDEGIIVVQAILKASFFGNSKTISIVIEDNGNGMPENINFEKSTGFGLMLVGMLTKQLRGKIRIERKNGTKIVLEFEK